MNHDKLMRLLRARHELRLHDAPRQHHLRTPQCLSLPRLTEENRTLWTAEEESHVRTCVHCQRMLQLSRSVAQQEEPHPAWWELVLLRRDRLTEPYRDAVKDHVQGGPCQRCLARLGNLDAERDRAVIISNVRLPAAGSVADKPHSLTGTSLDGVLEVEIATDARGLVLEARTRDPAFNQRLLGYLTWSAEEGPSAGGFLVLHPDVNGWFAAQTQFSAADGGHWTKDTGEDVLVYPLSADLLAGADLANLRASARRDRQDTEVVAVWTSWVNEQVGANGALPEDVRSVLGRLCG